MSASSSPDATQEYDARDAAVIRWALDVSRFVRHPVFPGIALALGLALAGVVILVVSGLGIGDQFYVSLQVPYLISGGFAAVGLIIVGAFVASVLGTRRDRAEADAEMAVVVEHVTELARLAALRRRTGNRR